MLATINPTTGTEYMTADHLGSPRLVTDTTGAVVSRHDYRAFGRELMAGEGGRTGAQGFDVEDGLRQKFTQKERDEETGLDYFGALVLMVRRDMSDIEGQSSQEQPALWQVAHGPDEKLRKHIRARFRELYEAAGEPQGGALYKGVDSGGFFSAICLNPEAARLFPELLSGSSPWYAYEHRPNILHWGLVDGDERLRNR